MSTGSPQATQEHSEGTLGWGSDQSCSAAPKESLNTSPTPTQTSRLRSAQEPSPAPRMLPPYLRAPKAIIAWLP